MLILKNCSFVPSLTEGVDFDKGDVLVNGNKIEKIAPLGTDFGVEAEVMDLGGKTLLPGLIDMHTHLFLKDFGELFNNQHITAPMWTITAVRYAKVLLEAGYTTVRDCGDQVDLPAMYVRNAINKGEIPGPRVLTSGPIAETSWTTIDILQNFADGPYEMRKLARQTLAKGADFIKIYGSGSLLVPSNEPGYPIIEEDEIKEAVNIAKRNSTYASIHAHGKTAVDMAVRCGVRTIEHATMIGEETLNYMEEHYDEVGIVPTMYAYWDILNEGDTPNGIRARALEPTICGCLRSAYHNHNVQIGWGTDMPLNTYEKDPMAEFRLRKEMLDYGNEDILKQATINSAKLMFMDDKIGSVKEGKLADLIVVDGDPVADISVMYTVPTHVIKDGKVVR